MLSRDNEFPLLHLESPGREEKFGDRRDEEAVMTTGDISIPGVGEESEQGACLKKIGAILISCLYPMSMRK